MTSTDSGLKRSLWVLLENRLLRSRTEAGKSFRKLLQQFRSERMAAWTVVIDTHVIYFEDRANKIG